MADLAAIGLNKILTLIFGERGTTVKDLFTWRGVGCTAPISVVANSVCIGLILTNIPEDLPEFDLELIKILIFSYFFFVLFNFLGDLISISITRHAVSRIIQQKYKLIRYLAMDISGIILGYLITLLPTWSVVIYCLVSGGDLNPWIHTGLLGNALIPSFLVIFATTNMPWPFLLFAIIAVLSITIPTAIYLFLMISLLFGYKFHRYVWKGEIGSSRMERILKLLITILRLLLFVLISLTALVLIFRYTS